MALKNIVYITQSQWEDLESQGYFIDGDTRHDYDADNEYLVGVEPIVPVTTIDADSTDEDVPSAKAVYDFVTEQVGDIETLLAAI